MENRIKENGPYELWDKCLKEIEEITLEYKDGKHIAPNGLPSRLPEIYAKVVRTPTFLKWFGDWTKEDKKSVSKVVYEDTGEPMLCFHGTQIQIPLSEGLKPMPNLKEPHLHNRIYFGSDFNYPLFISSFDMSDGGVYSCFLNIKNPITNDKDVYLQWDKTYDRLDKKVFRYLRSIGKDGFFLTMKGKDGDSYIPVVENANQVMQLASSPDLIKSINKQNQEMYGYNPDGTKSGI